MIRIAGSEVTGGATWGAADIGDLTGRVALVTGANSGIGYQVAAALAEHGAHVIMACRDREKARRARDKLESELERSSLELLHLDLADLVSVRRAAAEVLARHARLDILVNNAGVMGTPYRQTADGFELQMATNHLGHFALTGLLLDRIVTTERSRIVTVSSHMHRMGRLRPDDVAGAAFHTTWIAYGTSKLANLLFTSELSRRLRGGRSAHLGPGRSPWLDPQQPGRERCGPRGQPPAPEARADGRIDASGSRPRVAPCPSCAPRPRRRSARASTSVPPTSSACTGRPGWRGPRGRPGIPGRRASSGPLRRI